MDEKYNSLADNSWWGVSCPAHGLRVLDLHGPEPMCPECRVVVGLDGAPIGARDA